MVRRAVRERRARRVVERASKLELWRSLSRSVFERDGWRCRRCRRVRPLTAHHLLPRSRGGRDELSNLVSLCLECHATVQPRWREFREEVLAASV